ncbi:MAG: hypothetical protein JNM43_13855 [Planctomycetaceae bacterium]|nr:hypothetical protein [Planctomycetaceae bacterium]
MKLWKWNSWALQPFLGTMILVAVIGVAGPANGQDEAKPEAKSEAKQKAAATKRLNGSPLQKAIARGMEPGGDLTEELATLEDSSFRSAADATAICDALKRLPAEEVADKPGSRLEELTDLFLEVADESPGEKVLREKGIPELIRLFREMKETKDEEKQSDLMNVLRTLAMFGTREGAETIVEAARSSFMPDDYVWHITLRQFTPENPQHTFVFEELSKQLPEQFIGISFLDVANESALAEKLTAHPFDSDAGIKLLRGWIENKDEEHYSYAHSVATALPFLKHAERNSLLSAAMKHPDSSVRLESASAAAKLGMDEGFKTLADACLDVNLSMPAKQYLEELKRVELIPEAAKDPAFAARADFAYWLAHPNELGEAADEVEVVDHRELVWPPAKTAKHFWLLRYRLTDKTGLEDDNENYGLVGSQTWCFFDDHMMQRPIEDVYAIHYCFEQKVAELIDEAEVEGPEEEQAFQKQWTGAELQDVQLLTVVRMSLRLKYPTRRIAVGTAKQDGQDGWVIFDGDRSRWYPASEQPPETSDETIWRIHVGRRLLGFTAEPDRKSLLQPKPAQHTPEQFLEAYEKQLNAPLPTVIAQQEDRFSTYAVLGRNFEKYIENLMAVRSLSKADATIVAYEQFLQLAEQTAPSVAEDVYGVSTVLSEHFEAYTNALIEKGRTDDVAALITRLTPHFDHNLGHVQLGAAAFRINNLELAETHFKWMLDADAAEICHWDEVGLVAEVLQKKGEDRKAKDLLIQCMTELASRIREGSYSDINYLLEPYQLHRAAYLRLYPQGQAELNRKGLVENPE